MRILSIIIGIALAAMLLGKNAFASTDLEELDIYGKTPLIQAAYDGDLEAVKELIQDGANVDAQDNNGMSSLMWASNNILLCRDLCGNYLFIVRELLDAGANPDLQEDAGWTALMLAVRSRSYNIVNELIAAGADISIRSDYEGTALLLAAYYRRTMVYQLAMLSTTSEIDEAINYISERGNYRLSYDDTKKVLLKARLVILRTRVNKFHTNMLQIEWDLRPNRNVEAYQLEISTDQLNYIVQNVAGAALNFCLLYTSPSPRDRQKSRMPSSA